MKLSEKLRKVTKEHHDLAERINPARGIMIHDIGLTKFKEFLTANLYAYTVGVDTIFSSGKELPDQLKTLTVFKMPDFLKKDLSLFKGATYEYVADELKIDDDFPSSIGVLYVLQGSMLGTMVLKKNYEQCDLSKEVGKPNCFYGMDAGAIGKEWRGFIDFIDTLPLSEIDVDNACFAAKAAFELFIHLYEKVNSNDRLYTA